MTKEIFNYAEHDNEIYENDRYRIFANRVCPDCEIIDVSPEDKVTDPQIFGGFYSSFETILNTIHTKNPDALIYINISSGTPAMKSALKLLCTIASNLPLCALQISSPEEKWDDSKPVGLDYDIENEWHNLIDNDESLNPQNRCRSLKDIHDEIKLFTRFNAEKLIQNYDYNAAYDVLLSVQSANSAAIALLLAAKARFALKQKEAAEYAQKAGYPLFPIQTGGVCKIFEYILYLQIKVKRGEITEFARGVSPVLTSLFICHLKNIYNIDIVNSCTIPIGNTRKLDEQKLKDAVFGVYMTDIIITSFIINFCLLVR
jgi:CRISPR type III-A/MTUBE-associated protein Csm6